MVSLIALLVLMGAGGVLVFALLIGLAAKDLHRGDGE
jgi:hypothetical protein